MRDRDALALTDLSEIEVIATNFKRRLSGVTSTIVQSIPKQIELGCHIATLGAGACRKIYRSLAGRGFPAFG